MRDPDRLDNLYEAMLKVHKEKFSDWRFGQFMSNFLSWCIGTGRCPNILFQEDDKWEQWVEEYAMGMKWNEMSFPKRTKEQKND